MISGIDAKWSILSFKDSLRTVLFLCVCLLDLTLDYYYFTWLYDKQVQDRPNDLLFIPVDT